MNDLSSMNNLDKGDEGSVCNVYSVGEGSLLCGQCVGGVHIVVWVLLWLRL